LLARLDSIRTDQEAVARRLAVLEDRLEQIMLQGQSGRGCGSEPAPIRKAG
jgi:hypothetical protein